MFAARFGKACDKAVSDGIAHGGRDDRDRGRRLLDGAGHRCTRRDDDVGVQTRQLGRESRQPLEHPVRSSVFDDDVLAFDIAAPA
jgi:hypothetical protein